MADTLAALKEAAHLVHLKAMRLEVLRRDQRTKVDAFRVEGELEEALVRLLVASARWRRKGRTWTGRNE